MKVLHWAVLISVASTWGTDILVDACETVVVSAESTPICVARLASATTDDEGAGCVVVRAAGKGCDVPCVIQVSDGGNGSRKRVLIKRIGHGEDDGNAHIVTRLVGTVGGDDVENAGWLGVQMSSVEGALATQLGDAEGILVVNVIEDSPAAEAGFEQHDIIIEINDAKIGDDMAEMGRQIRESGAGSRLKFTVLRDGGRHTLVATLGERSKGTSIWLHKFAPDAEVNEVFKAHLKFLSRGDDGEWTLEELGDLKHLKKLGGLPGAIKLFMPNFDHKSIKVFINDGEPKVSIHVTRDGESISIEREGEDGEFVVRREDEDGEVTEERFADAEAFEAADEEAFQIFNDSTDSVVWTSKDGHSFSIGANVDFDFDFDEFTKGANHWMFKFDDENDSFSRWQEEISERLEDAGGAYAEALEKLKLLDLGNLPLSLGKLKGLPGGFAFGMHHGTARQSIHQNADGTVDLIVRKGDTEVITHYSDIDDLEDRNPSAFEKYRELLEDIDE